MRLAARLLPLLVFLPLAAAAGEAGYTSRDVELRAEPAGGAAVVGKLAKGDKLEILAEQRAWSQVKAGNATGWTLSFYVMKGEPAPERRMGRRLGELFSLGTERRAETSATIGIRGLDEEQLKSAQYNEQELKRMEALAVPRAEGDAFAKRGQLAPQKVDYLAPPAAQASPAVSPVPAGNH
jgi:hypothetical protein